MLNDNNQEGVLLRYTGDLKTMLGDLRRDLRLSGKDAPGDDARLVRLCIEKAHARLMESLGYDPATAAAQANRNSNASVESGQCSELDRISAAFGRTPEWLRAQERLNGH